ncbi:MAG: ABC transporter ATP-binding protein [Steroidobacteraceae bacterium]
MSTTPVLDVADLHVRFDAGTGPVHAVRGVSFEVAPGECFAIVGESGSGKSQLLLACLGLLASNGRMTGRARLEGVDLADAGASKLRGARVGYVSQDPMGALTPHLRIGEQLAEYLVHVRGEDRAAVRRRAIEALVAVGIDDPEKRALQYPHELSGGQRQRVAIAMALMPGPALLVADEPTTALDVTVQAQVLGVLRGLRSRGLSIVLVSHDLGVVAGLADRVGVMYAGELVETAGVQELYASPRHPYTAALLASVPRLDVPVGQRLAGIAGQPPRPGEVGAGCAYAPRCSQARVRCHEAAPVESGDRGRRWRCHAPLPDGWNA